MCSSSAEQRVLREERGERELPAQRLQCWGCRVAHQWLQIPNYFSLMSTHTVIRGVPLGLSGDPGSSNYF